MYLNFETKKWHGIVNRKNGTIIVTEKSHCVLPRSKELNVKDSINAFPCTDEDFIIIAARKTLKGEQL